MEKQSLPKPRSRVRFPYPAPKIPTSEWMWEFFLWYNAIIMQLITPLVD